MSAQDNGGPSRLQAVSLIDPKNGKKYSPNLYKWMRYGKGKRLGLAHTGVYIGNDGVYWIGYVDSGLPKEVIGAKLLDVLCNGCDAFSAAWQNVDCVEVPDFWADYVANGRCAIDKAHQMRFIGDSTRWSSTDAERSCKWCGSVKQTLKRWSVEVEKTAWAAA